MKRLLVYNQLPDSTLVYGDAMGMNLQIEEVSSISEVFKRQLFRVKEARDSYDAFMIYINDPTREITEFVAYIRKTKPELPLIILSRSTEKTLLLKSLLKGVTGYFLESDQLEYAFDQNAPFYASQDEAAKS